MAWPHIAGDGCLVLEENAVHTCGRKRGLTVIQMVPSAEWVTVSAFLLPV